MLATPCAAQAAPAGNVEVVTRAWGADGAAPSSLTMLSAWVVSDNGRYIAFSGSDLKGLPSSTIDWARLGVPLYVRDVRLNRTYQLTGDATFGRATGIDRSGRYISYEVSPVGLVDLNPDTELWVYDVVTQAKRLVGRASGAYGVKAKSASGVISGDGKSVVFTARDLPGFGSGVFRRSLATFQTVQIGAAPDAGSAARPTSVSDDGTVVALTIRDAESSRTGAVLTPTRAIPTTDWAIVSPDGTFAAYLDKIWEEGTGTRAELAQIDTATGHESRVPGPTEGDLDVSGGGPDVGWISPDGAQIAVLPPLAGEAFITRARFDTQVWHRSTGAYTTPGPYGDSLSGTGLGEGLGKSAISRSGRFVAFGPWDYDTRTGSPGLVVADFWQQGLPGGADAPPANWYFQNLATYCSGGQTVQSIRSYPAPRFLPKAKSVRGVVKAGGQTYLDATVTGIEQVEVAMPPETRSSTVTITAVLEDGRTVTGSYGFTFDPNDVCG